MLKFSSFTQKKKSCISYKYKVNNKIVTHFFTSIRLYIIHIITIANVIDKIFSFIVLFIIFNLLFIILFIIYKHKNVVKI